MSCSENYKDNADLQIEENRRIKNDVEQLSKQLKASEESKNQVN